MLGSCLLARRLKLYFFEKNSYTVAKSFFSKNFFLHGQPHQVGLRVLHRGDFFTAKKTKIDLGVSVAAPQVQRRQKVSTATLSEMKGGRKSTI